MFYFVEHIVVMGTVIEVFTHPVKDEEEGRDVFDRLVEDPIEEKWFIRLLRVTETGPEVILEMGSFHEV